MAKRTRRAVEEGRVEKKEAKGHIINPKYEDERAIKASPVLPKTENQKRFIQAVQRDTLIVCRGAAGTGKSYLSASLAANKLLKGECEYIVLIRPYISLGKTTGFWPGTILDRLRPYLAPMLNVLEERLGKSHFNNLIEKNILIQPMEAVRGMDFKDSFVICDEGQNITKEEARSLVTRISGNTQMVLIGDDRQSDLRQKVSGLTYISDLINRYDIDNASTIEFTSDDVIRSDIVGTFVKIFDKEGWDD